MNASDYNDALPAHRDLRLVEHLREENRRLRRQLEAATKPRDEPSPAMTGAIAALFVFVVALLIASLSPLL